jgi:heterodisulfide reductase subunit C
MPKHAGNGLLRPGELGAREAALRSAFLAEVDRIPGGDRVRRCIQCGTCSGSCPVSHAMDYQPREIVALFRAGDLTAVLESRTLWLCASCYACTVRCPAGIKVTDLIYGLKRLGIEQARHPRGAAADLSVQFIRLLRQYGRNPETSLMVRHLLKRSPRRLLASIPDAWRMWRAGRLPGRPDRVRDIEGLRRIIDRAEAMESDYPRDRSRPQGGVGYGVVTEQASGGSVS